MAVQTLMQVRRGTLSQWNAANVSLGAGILYQGELGYETDTGRFKIGDGSTAWSSLSYASVLPSNFTAGSGISITQGTNGSTLTISLSDPSIQVADITDFAEGVDDRVSSLLQAGTNILLSYNDEANTLTINSTLGTEEVQDAIGTYLTGISGISVSYNDTTGYTTLSLSDPTIQASDVTDFSEAVDDRVSSLISSGSGIGVSYNDNSNSLLVSVTGIPVSLVTDFTSGVNALIDNAVSTSIVGGSGVDLMYNSETNTLTISSSLSAGSGISVSHNAGTYTIGLSDPTIQLADITDLSSDARTFLATPSSTNLASLVSDETGSGALVFANNPVMSGVTVNGNLTVSGSGLVASNINNFDSQVRTSRLDQMAVPTSDVSFNNVKITGLASPTSDNDAATKAYVDAARLGLDVKESVRVATTANITLSGTQTIDGIVVVSGDRVLVKDQSTASQNGIYIVDSGSWTRASDANSDAKVTAGLFAFVSEGSANADSGWVLTTNDIITLGTTGLVFAQFSGAGQVTAGNGLTKNGSTIDVVGTADRIVVNADSIDLATVSRSDSTGSAGISFLQSVTTDSYGRVTSSVSGVVQDASTSIKGVASFDSGDFSVTNGAVTIKSGGIDNAQLANSAVTIGSSAVSLGGTITSVSGLSSVSSTTFVGNLTGTADNANNIEVDLVSSNINNLVFVSGTNGNLKPSVNNNLKFDAANNELLGSSSSSPATTLKYFIIDGGTP